MEMGHLIDHPLCPIYVPLITSNNLKLTQRVCVPSSLVHSEDMNKNHQKSLKKHKNHKKQGKELNSDTKADDRGDIDLETEIEVLSARIQKESPLRGYQSKA